MIPRHLAAAGCGVLFGLGLAVSQMANPAKVIGFLDVAGRWDASLLFVLGGAVAITVAAFRFVPRLARPLFDAEFERAAPETIDASLIGGAAIFGIGWGLSGYCPGPGIVALGRFAPDAFVFVAAFLIGSAVYRTLSRMRVNVRRRSRALP